MESGSVGTLKTEEMKTELSARLISAVRTRQRMLFDNDRVIS